MTEEEKNLKIEEMRSLVQQLNEASASYYNGQEEKMTDFEWDAMFDQVKQLERETSFILEDSPTNNVSADTTAGEKEAHEYSALSLAKTKNPEELVKWAEGRKIWLSWKLDGLTLVVTYDHGRLTKVVTRGDGHIGTNITHLAKAIEGILPTVKEEGHLVIRGEAIISYEDFNQFLIESGEDYANPRNLAAGSLTLKDTEEVKRRKIRWIPFTLVHTNHEIISWGEQMDYLSNLGFFTVDHEAIISPTSENIHACIDQWTHKVTDGENPYPVDGLVIAYDDTVYASTGSVTGHHATRAGYAFKWADESVESSLDHIEWSCAASSITPVAVFEPVQLEGTVVQRASLCNISECERLGIGSKGTILSVIKANKIIPKIIQVRKKEGSFEIPSVCPVCGSSTEVHVSDISETKTLRCSNPSCAAKKLKKFTRFVSKAGMDIDGISEQTLSRFINEGWIHTNADIYHLPDHAEQIAQLDGFGEKSSENITASIEKSRTVDDNKLLYALNIPLAAQDVSRRLLNAYPLQELIQKAEETEDTEVFSSIDGIGPEKSTAFVQYFKDAENVNAFNALMQEITVKETAVKAEGDHCTGLIFVVTGDVHHYANRNELKAYIESQGGKVTGSVTAKTDYLINNDLESTSSKNTKAKASGVPIISEDDFIAKFTDGVAE